MPSVKQTCISLREKGHTLPEIVNITGRPKSSVYGYIRGIELSATKQDLIREASAQRARNVALKRKGKSLRPFRSFEGWNSALVLLVGHLLFDGEIGRGKCVYNNRSEVLIARVEGLMKLIYDFEPKRYVNNSTGVSRIAYFNVELGSYLRIRSEDLLNSIGNLPLELKREFTRSFFDDEGCMDFRPQRNLRQIRGYQKDTKILSLIQKLLADLSIDSRIRLPNEILISGKMNLKSFQCEVDFSPGVCVNGNRTNSLWKANIEKRELLSRALESYKT